MQEVLRKVLEVLQHLSLLMHLYYCLGGSQSVMRFSDELSSYEDSLPYPLHAKLVRLSNHHCHTATREVTSYSMDFHLLLDHSRPK
jgi:hypothetical protein